MYPFLRELIELTAERFERSWPTTAAIYLPVRAVGERQINAPLAGWLASLCDAERAAGGSREAGIRAARDSFYCGAGAEAIDRFARIPVRDVSREKHAGLIRADDLAGYAGAVEQPLSVGYRGARVWKTGPWGQGPVFLQQLRLLEGFDLGALDPSSAEWLHLWLETSKLAFADRDACYGDPRFADVPLETLLSRDYAAQRRALVDPDKASLELRPGLGRLPAGWPLFAENDAALRSVEPGALVAARGRTDTTQCVSVDAAGNAVSATPSGGWIMTSPAVPELGFPLGTRLQMASLDPDHPNALAPGKRPRTTLSPSLAQLADGRWLAFGTPGGDQQDQWTSQFFLRLAAHGERDLQAAIDAPTVHSEHMPSSFYPRCARPGVVAAESRFDPAVLRALEARGHRLERKGPWEHGRVLAAAFDPSGGPNEAAASPRFAIAYAIALP
jgi:gamma-glutamyltranspeptidase / glutathione hydrolase